MPTARKSRRSKKISLWQSLFLGGSKRRVSRPRQPTRRRSQSRLGRRRTMLFSSLPWASQWRRVQRLPWGRSLALGLAGAAVILVTLILTSPALEVNEIIITGNRGISTEEVRRVVEPLARGRVFLVNTGAIERAVAVIPGVHSVEAHWHWSGVVTVVVSDQTPEIVWQVRDTTYLIGPDSTVIRAGIPNGPLLAVRDMDGDFLQPGDVVDREAIVTAQRTALLLGQEVTGFEYARSQGGLSAIGRAGWRALFGNGQNLEAKIANLRVILKKAQESKIKIQWIDLRVPERPTYR